MTDTIPPSSSSNQGQQTLSNWAGNIQYSTNHICYPETVEAVQQAVRQSERMKALGTRHCFNHIADSNHKLLSTRNLNKIISLDEKQATVTVEAGIKYGELSPFLHDRGFALHNLASLPHISVAGACMTATHGSGIRNGNLATVVKALQLVTAGGDLVELSREKDEVLFPASVVSLGALGVVTALTLRVQPAFKMYQRVFMDLPLETLQHHFESILSTGYSISLFTDWQKDSINQVWIKDRLDASEPRSQTEHFFGAAPATANLHPIAEMPSENCTDQMATPGHWHERLPHFKMGFTPSSGLELQSEYFVPFHNGVEAVMAIQRLGKQIGPHLLISEIRTIAADDLWLSPCRDQASMAIHFTWKQESDAVSRLLPLIERELMPFGVKPHWGKLFTLSPQLLASQYERMEDFRKLAFYFDPKGKFRNAFLSNTVYGDT